MDGRDITEKLGQHTHYSTLGNVGHLRFNPNCLHRAPPSLWGTVRADEGRKMVCEKLSFSFQMLNFNSLVIAPGLDSGLVHTLTYICT